MNRRNWITNIKVYTKRLNGVEIKGAIPLALVLPTIFADELFSLYAKSVGLESNLSPGCVVRSLRNPVVVVGLEDSVYLVGDPCG